MNITIQINNVPDKFKTVLTQVMDEFNGVAGDMVSEQPIVIEFSKLPATPEVADYMGQIVSSSMALHAISKI
jgi:hypothetical protein